MAKIVRNAPCPCGSRKKYKKCCLSLHRSSSSQQNTSTAYLITDLDHLDNLSNSAVDLIEEGRLDKAEEACQELLSRYPDQIDGVERLAQLYKARGDMKKAAKYYRKAATFAQSMPGFDQEAIEWYLSQAKALDSEK